MELGTWNLGFLGRLVFGVWSFPKMTSVFDALPGLQVPVSGIAPGLARLWEGEPGEGNRAPS